MPIAAEWERLQRSLRQVARDSDSSKPVCSQVLWGQPVRW
jgi:hypothetical protein